MFGFRPRFPLLLIICASCVIGRARSTQLNDILTASTDFLEKIVLNEIDFSSADAFSEPWLERAEMVLQRHIKKLKDVHQLDQDHVIDKRGIDEPLSITRDFQGVNVLASIEELYDTSAKYPSDITLFYMLNDKGIHELFVATLESNEINPELERANLMVIYKFESDRFKFLDKTSVMGGVDLESFNINGVPYIVAAEYDAGSSGRPLEGSAVYRIINKKLERVQTLNTKYPSDIAVWEDMNEVYIAVAISQVNQSPQSIYEADSIVFRWRGGHFDAFSTVKTYNAKCVTPFKIGSTMFLAVANHQNNHGETDIDSEIFKYNLNEDSFVSYQKIRTHAAMDIKFFTSANKRKREHFLVVANSFEIGLDGTPINETGSIIYKYADDYFVPFQSITLSSATHWLPIAGPRGELVLVAACESGILTFQYDGWRFVKTNVQYSTATLGPGIASIRSFLFRGALVLAVANRHKFGRDADIFNLKFKPTYNLQEFHLNMLDWCESMTEAVDAEDLGDLMEQISIAPKYDDDTVSLTGSLVIESSAIQKLEVDNFTVGEDTYMDENLIIELNKYANDVDKVENELKSLQAITQNSMKVSGTNHIQGSLKFSNIDIVFMESEIADADINTLNGKYLDSFLQNAVYLTGGQLSDNSLEFESVAVEVFQDGPLYFNGHPTSAIVGKSTNAHFLGMLSLDGTATLMGGLSVGGTIDGLVFSPEVILLADVDQTLYGSISSPSASVNNLDMVMLNGMNANLFFHDTVKVNGNHAITAPTVLKDVRVEKMTVNGPVHGKSLESLVDSALKVCGDQIITGKWSFEKLKCGAFVVEGSVSGVNLETEVVRIHGFGYIITGGLEFTVPLWVEHLHVNRNLNDIGVTNGMLDVVLLSHSETLNITGHKEFESVHVKSKLSVSSTFNEIDIPSWNPVKEMHGSVVINDDVRIIGQVYFNGNLVTGDLKDKSRRFSAARLMKHGISLENPAFTRKTVINVETMRADYVQIETLNGIRPETWVTAGSFQSIFALKNFDGGLNVMEPTVLTGLMNGVDIMGLDGYVLKIYGNQTVFGVKSFKDIKAPSFQTKECLFGDKLCKDLMLTSKTQNITGSSFFKGSVEILNDLVADNVTVEGLVNEFDLSYLMDDTLFGDGVKVESSKIFQGPLSFDSVQIHGKVGELDIKNLLSLLYERQFTTYVGATIISQPTTIENFQLRGRLHGMRSEEFGTSWLLARGEQNIETKQIFSRVTMENNAVILSGGVNGWNLSELESKAAMINKNCSLGSIKFNKVNGEGPVNLEGLFQNLNLDDIVLTNNSKTVEISAKKVLRSNLIIEGNLFVDNIVKNVDFEKVCQLLMGYSSDQLEVIIDGNVEMELEPVIKVLNRQNIQSLFSDVWMSDRETILSGSKNFQKMAFNGEVQVEGMVDGVDINSLPAKCLSKTKDQVIQGAVSFPGGVLFEKLLTAPKAYVSGDVSGLDLRNFNEKVLLSGPDQHFVGAPTFEEIITKGHVDVGGLVNGLDLDKDVMLLDSASNVISGRLEVKSVYTPELRLGENAKIQGVDIPRWNELALKAVGDQDLVYNVRGTKTFKNAVFKDEVLVGGNVGNMKFDDQHIMLRSKDQNVTGMKNFMYGLSKHEKYSLSLDLLEIDGHLNGVKISDFLGRLAHRNEDIVFNEERSFSQPMSVQNVFASGLYHGLNISAVDFTLVPKVHEKILAQLNQLNSATKNLKESLNRRAIYASHYENVQDFGQEAVIVLPVSWGEETSLAVISFEISSDYVLEIYNWDSNHGIFTKGEMGAILGNVKFAASLECLDTHLVYIEIAEEGELEALKENSEDLGINLNGYFLKFTLEDGMSKSSGLEMMGTVTAISVEVPHHTCCFLFAQQHGPSSSIMCPSETSDRMTVFQSIPTGRIIEASSGSLGATPYIALLMDDETREISKITIWLFSNDSKVFKPFQEIFIEGARSIASEDYRGISYLAVASGNVLGAVGGGIVKIYRFDPFAGTFMNWLNLDAISPWSVRFHILPSDELVLYVSTQSPVKPLIVLVHKGLEGFKELTHAAHAPYQAQLNPFRVGRWNNFVGVSGIKGSRIFKTAFKGV